MPAAAGKHGCVGETRSGRPCSSYPLTGTELCMAHSDEETKQKARFGGAQEGAGRPPKPKVIDIFRAKVEAEADEWFKVLTDAREATHAVVTWNGESNDITFVDDHRTRLAAFKQAMDRVFGKPMQYVDVTAREEESEVDREIAQLLAQMDQRDPQRKDVAKANGRLNGKAAA